VVKISGENIKLHFTAPGIYIQDHNNTELWFTFTCPIYR